MVRGRRFGRVNPWFIGLGALVLGAVLPLALVAWWTDDPPELRVFVTAGELSGLIIDGNARVLVINSDDREVTAEALGIMARPWEPGPQILIAPADDRAATGLWEALARTDPSGVVIAGIPGAEPIWAAIEDACREREIDLRYVAGTLALDTEHLTITVFGPVPEGGGPAAVVVRHDGVNALIALGSDAPDIEAQVAIANTDPGIESISVLISAQAVALPTEVTQIIISEREIIHMRFEDARVRIQGGMLLAEPAAQPTETRERE
jgi:hypothetical protein